MSLHSSLLVGMLSQNEIKPESFQMPLDLLTYSNNLQVHQTGTCLTFLRLFSHHVRYALPQTQTPDVSDGTKAQLSVAQKAHLANGFCSHGTI